MTTSGQALEEAFLEEAQALLRRSNEYWIQALEQLKGGHLEKASELGWGSVLERVKAVALVRMKVPLRSHREVHSYVRRMAITANDEDLLRAFQRAESLHINFYESFFEPGEVEEGLATLAMLLPKLDSYMVASSP